MYFINSGLQGAHTRTFSVHVIQFGILKVDILRIYILPETASIASRNALVHGGFQQFRLFTISLLKLRSSHLLKDEKDR